MAETKKKLIVSEKGWDEVRALGGRVKVARLARGLTQEAAAALAAASGWIDEGFSQPAWLRVEKGQINPTVIHIRAIAKALDVPASYIGFSEEAKVSPIAHLVDALLAQGEDGLGAAVTALGQAFPKPSPE